MKAYGNNRETYLVPDVSVRHALVDSGLIDMIQRDKNIHYEARNEIGLDWTLTEVESLLWIIEKNMFCIQSEKAMAKIE